MNLTIQDIYKINIKVLHAINNILNNIMEFYTLMQIYNQSLQNNHKFIIHKGLFHTSNLLVWLIDIYGFTNIDSSGLTEFDKIDDMVHNGCHTLPTNI